MIKAEGMSRKFLITIVLLLFLLPFVSWYYLRSGLQWRKNAQESMKGTQAFPEMEYVDPSGQKFSADSLLEHVSIVTFTSCTGDTGQLNVLNALYDQFKETGKANFILLDSCTLQEPIGTRAPRKKWFDLSCVRLQEQCRYLRETWSSGKEFALVDRKGIIRSYYAIGSQEERKILMEHMALLLPRERQEKVELRRGDKK